MNDKDKEIKAIAKIINECCNHYDEHGRHLGNKCAHCEYWCDTNNICCSFGNKEATYLYELGYRKIPDGSVVSSRDYEIYRLGFDNGKIEARKETVKEILQEFALTPRTRALIMNKYGLSKEDSVEE